MAFRDVIDILAQRVGIDLKELAFCFEVAEQENQVDAVGFAAGGDGGAFVGAQVELQQPIFVGKRWPPVEVIDFLLGKDREPVSSTRHRVPTKLRGRSLRARPRYDHSPRFVPA